MQTLDSISTIINYSYCLFIIIMPIKNPTYYHVYIYNTALSCPLVDELDHVLLQILQHAMHSTHYERLINNTKLLPHECTFPTV